MPVCRSVFEEAIITLPANVRGRKKGGRRRLENKGQERKKGKDKKQVDRREKGDGK